ncbi:hypothetical protein C4564_03000 [Candidatus Microgenomates bacterium]|nr:MAG: hypothetical protein C4564_03000 [Candidatus Microgenomates bacterium]
MLTRIFQFLLSAISREQIAQHREIIAINCATLHIPAETLKLTAEQLERVLRKLEISSLFQRRYALAHIKLAASMHTSIVRESGVMLVDIKVQVICDTVEEQKRELERLTAEALQGFPTFEDARLHYRQAARFDLIVGLNMIQRQLTEARIKLRQIIIDTLTVLQELEVNRAAHLDDTSLNTRVVSDYYTEVLSIRAISQVGGFRGILRTLLGFPGLGDISNIESRIGTYFTKEVIAQIKILASNNE